MQASRASAAPREQAARILKNGRQAAHSADTVSYTHLTLPTIRLV